MLSRSVQLFSRKQTISVVTCVPCDTDSLLRNPPGCCDWQRARKSTTGAQCTSKAPFAVSAVKVPFSFPRAATLFTQSPGCSLDPISFGLPRNVSYHMQTRSMSRLSTGLNQCCKSRWAQHFVCRPPSHNKNCQLHPKTRALHTHCNLEVLHPRSCFLCRNTGFTNSCLNLLMRSFSSDRTTDKKDNYSERDSSNKQDNETGIPDTLLDEETKILLSEIQDDFKQSTETENNLLNSANSSSNSSSEDVNYEAELLNADTDSDISNSDSELEDHVIQDVLDHAEFYAEDGHKLIKHKPPVGKDRSTVDINEYSQQYSEVSKHANRVTQSEAAMPASMEIDIEEFSDYESEEEEEKPSYVPPIPLTRGSNGVFDLDDLLTLLRVEKVKDICVIGIPDEIQYVDYLVIGTPMSPRHMTALSETLKWIHKRRKTDDDPSVHMETGHNWTAVDLGNIALHLMTNEARQTYDIETLWTCGPDFDEKSREISTDPYAFPDPMLSRNVDTNGTEGSRV